MINESRIEMPLSGWNALQEKLRVAQDEARLLRDLIAYTIDRAPRCTHGVCRRVAFWVVKGKSAACPRDELLCDAHRAGCNTPIPGTAVLRRAIDKLAGR